MIDWFKISVWSVVIALCLAFWSVIIWAVASASWIALVAVILIGTLTFASFVALCMFGFAGQGCET